MTKQPLKEEYEDQEFCALRKGGESSGRGRRRNLKKQGRKCRMANHRAAEREGVGA